MSDFDPERTGRFIRFLAEMQEPKTQMTALARCIANIGVTSIEFVRASQALATALADFEDQMRRAEQVLRADVEAQCQRWMPYALAHFIAKHLPMQVVRRIALGGW